MIRSPAPVCDECGHLASEHAEGYVCTHLMDDPDDGWYGVCPCVRRDDNYSPRPLDGVHAPPRGH